MKKAHIGIRERHKSLNGTGCAIPALPLAYKGGRATLHAFCPPDFLNSLCSLRKSAPPGGRGRMDDETVI